MSTQTQPPIVEADDDAFELDIQFIESGDLQTILYDTGDNCGQTCQSACNSCP
ncbi:FxLD family lanthipeptide [Glycomyces harbinensis]|uniref:FxLD family lantipeptide n=1 Tax=Glycomyces harbinensis TaxID=58114 RepID=A0A1G6YBD7_9ACTN|nr:FxLD family lanthipeptide [Glycomyces harbinensis]SDD87037.1 FxLD family lantipeptide [Glycomyces harbinensis]